MGSKSRDIYVHKVESLTTRLKQIRAELTEQGYDHPDIDKHVKVRKLQADLRRINHRLGALDALDEISANLEEHKQKKAVASAAQETAEQEGTRKSKKPHPDRKHEREVRRSQPADEDDEPETKAKAGGGKKPTGGKPKGAKKDEGKRADQHREQPSGKKSRGQANANA